MPGGPVFILEVSGGPEDGQELPLPDGDIVLGSRPTCGVRLTDESVGPAHCGLRVRVDQVIIAPGGRVMKTRINGQPLTRAQLLRVGDTIEIGPYSLVLRIRVPGDERRFYPGDAVGPYRLVAELGSGAVGRVFEAVDAAGQTVAVKMLRLQDSWSPPVREHRFALFRREVQALTAVNHPNVVRCFGSGEQAGVPWLAMELLEGGTLRELLAGGRPDVRTIERLMFQLCSAVAAVHDAGVVHRDLKPANVMLVDNQQRVVLADFGLAQKLGGPRLEELDPPGFSTAVRVGKQVGTPAFMPPEQTQGRDADQRSDVWSLGVVLYQLISGRLPFAGKSIRTMLTNVCTACPEPLPRDVAPYLRGVVYKCLQKRPEWRFPTARQMVETLHDKQVVQLLPVGAEGPPLTTLQGCPFCHAPIEHLLECVRCHNPIFRYIDGQVLTVPLADNRIATACATCGSAVLPNWAQCPTCAMVYTDQPPPGSARSAITLEVGGPLIHDIFDEALEVLAHCPYCNTPKQTGQTRCKACHFPFRAYVTSRVNLDLAVGGWKIHCGACGALIDAPDEPHCPACGLNVNNGMFPDGTRFADEVPHQLMSQIERQRTRTRD